MTLKSILMTSGATVLTVAAVFAGRASKFADAPNLYYSAGSGAANCHAIRTSQLTSDFTTGGTGTQASIKTVSNGSRLVWATSTCAKAVHFRPI